MSKKELRKFTPEQNKWIQVLYSAFQDTEKDEENYMGEVIDNIWNIVENDSKITKKGINWLHTNYDELQGYYDSLSKKARQAVIDGNISNRLK